jgi:hypothetical protein
VGLFWLLLGQSWAASPVVNAGPDRELALPVRDLTLFGRAEDADDDPLTITWTAVSGPAPIRFSAPWALTTTASFTQPGTYVLQLAVSDGRTLVTDTATATIKSASSQTAFYVDPTYTGTTRKGTAAQPWRAFHDGNSQQSAQWQAINQALLSGDVIVYFSARQAASDTAEQINGAVRVKRLPRGQDSSTHRLTLDGMSMYNRNDANPSWVNYAGPHKARIKMTSGCCFSIGWDDDAQRDYITIRGFEVTGSGGRIRWGGSYSVLEQMWVHDITSLGATVQFNAAVTDYPACEDLGKAHDITVRNNRIERGIGEAIYIAGNYTFERYGGCPAYGNTHEDLLIEGNTIIFPGKNGDQGDGIDLKGGLRRVTVRNNVVQQAYAPGTGADNGGDGIVAEGVFPPDTSAYLFEGNRLYNGRGYGIIVGAPNGLVIRNNVLYGNRGGIYLAGDPSLPGANVEVYNNTVHGAGVKIGETHGIILRNNLLFGLPSGQKAISGWESTGIDSDYNLMAPRGSAFPEGSHSVVRSSNEGIVVNRTAGDFHLIETSPARDRGLDLSDTGITVDYDEVERPRGPAWDVGAYEF